MKRLVSLALILLSLLVLTACGIPHRLGSHTGNVVCNRDPLVPDSMIAYRDYLFEYIATPEPSSCDSNSGLRRDSTRFISENHVNTIGSNHEFSCATIEWPTNDPRLFHNGRGGLT